MVDGDVFRKEDFVKQDKSKAKSTDKEKELETTLVERHVEHLTKTRKREHNDMLEYDHNGFLRRGLRQSS